jgi:enoyl-CoA hydratase/carnithine racemase
MPPIHFEIQNNGIGILTLNRPHVRNALNWEAMHAFADIVEAAHNLPDLRTLIVTGSEGTFCAGGDLYELDGYPSHQDGVRLTTIMGDALNRLEDLPYPTVAAIEGPALGGGAEIALACDLRVMAESARLGLMHIRLAICPAWGGGQRLLRLVGYARALAWLTAGRVLTAAETLAYRLANRLTPDGQALEGAMELAASFTRHDPSAVRAIKRILRAGLTMSATEAAAAERSELPDLWTAPAHLEASERFVSKKKIDSQNAYLETGGQESDRMTLSSIQRSHAGDIKSSRCS